MRTATDGSMCCFVTEVLMSSPMSPGFTFACLSASLPACRVASSMPRSVLQYRRSITPATRSSSRVGSRSRFSTGSRRRSISNDVVTRGASTLVTDSTATFR